MLLHPASEKANSIDILNMCQAYFILYVVNAKNIATQKQEILLRNTNKSLLKKMPTPANARCLNAVLKNKQ